MRYRGWTLEKVKLLCTLVRGYGISESQRGLGAVECVSTLSTEHHVNGYHVWVYHTVD